MDADQWQNHLAPKLMDVLAWDSDELRKKEMTAKDATGAPFYARTVGAFSLKRSLFSSYRRFLAEVNIFIICEGRFS